MADQIIATSAEDSASLKWACIHSCRWLGRFALRHYLWTAAILLAAVILREELQPLVIWVRRFAAPSLLSAGFIILSWRLSRHIKPRWRLLKRGVAMLVALSFVAGFWALYDYISLWVRYESFHVETLDKIAQTGNERIPPLQSVYDAARGVMGNSRTPTQPDYVWQKNKKTGAKEYRFTMAVEPGSGKEQNLFDYALVKIFGSVEEVINVSGTDPSPDFSTEDSRIPVQFNVAEGLWLSSNASTAAVRRLNPLMFVNYEPTGEVRYLKDDDGIMVEVISLVRWRGVVFPYPEFGGVIIVKQSKPQSYTEVFKSFVERVAFGAGEWIAPERIREFPYLREQNILPYQVSRYIVESLRFMNGPLAPFPWWHQGDVRVPEPMENLNKQPYTTYFEEMGGLSGMLYHYFSLVPYMAGNNGLVASVFIPADGTQRVFVYKHAERGESLIGVNMVPSLVRNSMMTFNWDKGAAVEERPYVRYVNGKRHMLWLTTVVTYQDAKKDSVVAGSIPKVALVDAVTRDVIWVDPRDHEGWTKLLPK